MENRKDYFNRHASSWDEDIGYKDRTGQIREVVEWFGFVKDEWVLDVGSGTGILLSFIKEAIGPKGKLFAIDFSFKMLERAQIRQYPGEKNLTNASVESIPFLSNRFDRVVCFSAFPHFPNKARALFEMVRVLKNGGTVSIAHLHSVEEINQLHQKVGGPVAHDLLPHPERIRGLMRESGLDKVFIVNQPGKFLAQGRKI